MTQRFLALEPISERPGIAKFPVKFPVTREFAWRQVRSGTASPANQSGARSFYPRKCQKYPPVAGFCELVVSLQTPRVATCGAKSPIVFGRYFDIPVFRRRWPEIRFDRDCAAQAQSYSPHSPPIGMCTYDTFGRCVAAVWILRVGGASALFQAGRWVTASRTVRKTLSFDLPERTTVCSVVICPRLLRRRDDKQNDPNKYSQQNRQGD